MSEFSTDPLWDVVIVGGGAAGLMAAIFAGRQAATLGRSSRLLLLDAADKPGAKILVSGGGRCNVTHCQVSETDYAGDNPKRIARVLRCWPVEQTVAFFDEIGVPLKTEPTGKLFPVSDRAQTVLDALTAQADRWGIVRRSGVRIEKIERHSSGSGFVLSAVFDEFFAKRVILATGGRSLPKTGSDGQGYVLAQSLGHTLRPTFASLVPLVLPEGHWMTSLSGIVSPVQLSVHAGSGKRLFSVQGEMLMTHFGVSGPAVLDISRHYLAAKASDPQAKLRVNFFPGEDFLSLEKRFIRMADAEPNLGAAALMRRWFAQRLAHALVEQSPPVKLGSPIGHMARELRRLWLHFLCEMELPIERDRGWLFAEATAGGVPLSEVDPARMESRCSPGVFLAGEMLDVDGRLGGFNFQWAWASGRLAGMSSVQ